MMESSWCMIDLDGKHIRALIAPRRGDKFTIEDDVSGRHKGKVIDSSDIISCNIDRKH